jgi:sugar O-acyltransferase (sialic acid O-acetyltransferase NeuD family)
MQDVVIFGSSGLGREVHQLIDDINQEKLLYNCVGFLSTFSDAHGSNVHDLPVLGGIEWLINYPFIHVIVAVGNPSVKRKIVKKIQNETSNKFCNLIHPQASFGKRNFLGEGVVICAGARVTTDITIGNHVFLNINCTVGHDTVIEDFVTVSPGVNISGNVKVGEGCDLGTNSTVIQGLAIGRWSIVGAGAALVKDTLPNVTVVGMPAKVIKQRENLWYETL